jgi:3',5'-cyclic AMP phosphodiesterase CpdA
LSAPATSPTATPNGAAQTARLLDAIPGTVVTAGDNAYFLGSQLDYERCYEPTWGRHKARTRPSPGNHEYETAGGSAYFDYFGENAGPPGLGYYSFSTGGWLILSLNSSVDASELSSQMAWIRDTLRDTPTRCTMAIFHHPPAASGQHGGSTVMMDIWQTLARADVDVVMTGHEHLYERFAPMTRNCSRLRPASVSSLPAPEVRLCHR